MSVVYIDQEAVHYEVFGRGRPVLFLHGFLGSWRYWLPSMEVTATSFRTFSFDFIGFGDTLQRDVLPSIGAYADQVIRFLDALGIGKVTLVGHSMGGMVSLKTAIEHPERIERVVTVGAPIVGNSLTPLIKIMSNQTIAHLAQRTPLITKFLFKRALGNSSEEHTMEILEATIKPSSENVRASMRSMMHTDLRTDLLRLRVPSLAIHGTRDDIVSPSQIKVLRRLNLPYLRVVPMERCRHFPWNDEPDPFHAQLLEFLKTPLDKLLPHVPPPVPISPPPIKVSQPLTLVGGPASNSALAPNEPSTPPIPSVVPPLSAYLNGAVTAPAANGSMPSLPTLAAAINGSVPLTAVPAVNGSVAAEVLAASSPEPIAAPAVNGSVAAEALAASSPEQSTVTNEVEREHTATPQADPPTEPPAAPAITATNDTSQQQA